MGLFTYTFTVIVITLSVFKFFKERPNIPKPRGKIQSKQITYLSMCTEIDSHKIDVKKIK